MASRKPRSNGVDSTPSAVESLAQKPTHPLVFISHDHRDAELAEAFSNLLTGASGGILKSFRSSDRKGVAGIEFGTEWYREIMGKIKDATDVVALLTANSVDRPWILYEAGVAKGNLDKQVFGVVVGITFEQATQGPFAQFQNSGDDEDSLTKLVVQLIKRNPEAEPSDEAVRLHVKQFRGKIETVHKSPTKKVLSAASEVDGNAAAKLFEEIKVMFRELPERLHGQFSESLGGRSARKRILHRRMFRDLIRQSAIEGTDPSLSWLIAVSFLRDDAPWLHDICLEVYRASQHPNRSQVLRSIERLEEVLTLIRRGPMSAFMTGSHEMDMTVDQLGDWARHLFVSGKHRSGGRTPMQERLSDEVKEP